MMRGVHTTESGNQDRRQPPFKRKKRKKAAKRKGRRRARGSSGSPLHDAMVSAAT